MVEKAKVKEGSGNVFADIGLPDAEERLAKAELVLVNLISRGPLKRV